MRYSHQRKVLLENTSSKDINSAKFIKNQTYQFLNSSMLSDTAKNSMNYFLNLESDNESHSFITKAQTIKYLKTPAEYFNFKEAYLIALNMKFHQKSSSLIKDKHFLDFLNYVSESPNPYQNSALEVLGIYYFDKGVHSKGSKKEKNLLAALNSFLACMKNGLASLLVVTKIGIIKGLLGKFEVAIKFLMKATKLTDNPYFHYQFIGKMYGLMNMNKEKVFYQAKAKKYQKIELEFAA